MNEHYSYSFDSRNIPRREAVKTIEVQVKIKPVLLHNFHLPMTPLLLLLLEKKRETNATRSRYTLNSWKRGKKSKKFKAFTFTSTWFTFTILSLWCQAFVVFSLLLFSVFFCCCSAVSTVVMLCLCDCLSFLHIRDDCAVFIANYFNECLQSLCSVHNLGMGFNPH